MKKSRMVGIVVLLAGCQRASTETSIPVPSAMARAQASTAPPSPDLPVLAAPVSSLDEDRLPRPSRDSWAILHDAGGTIFATLSGKLYRAEDDRLIPVDLAVEPGDITLPPARPYFASGVLGHYPDNLWLVMRGESHRASRSHFFVGRLEGSTLLGDHSFSSAPSRGNEMIPWTGTSVLQNGETLLLHEGRGLRHPMTGPEMPEDCPHSSLQVPLAHRGWVIAFQSCTPYRDSFTRWLLGPRGQRRNGEGPNPPQVSQLMRDQKGQLWGIGAWPGGDGSFVFRSPL
jgi:hypothetical protein